MNKKFKTLTMSVLLASCGFAFARTPVVVVKIGSAAPKTGEIAHLGKDNENGAQLAVNEINSKGDLKIAGQPVQLELVGEDDAGDPKQGPGVAQKLIAAKVVAVVGHLNSGVSIPANEVYARAGLVQVSPSSSNPDYTLKSSLTPKGHQSAYRVTAHDGHQGGAAAQMIKNKGFKRIVLLNDDTSYGRMLTNAVTRGLSTNAIVSRASISDKRQNFTTLIRQWKKLKVDAVFFGGMDSQAAVLVSQMKALNLKATLLGGDGVCTDRFIEEAGESGEGMLCVAGGVPLERMSKGANFAHKYRQAFGSNVQIYAPFAYDAVYAIVEAMKKANSTQPEAIAAAMPSVDIKGVTGRIRFDAKGDIRHGGFTNYLVHGGKLRVQDIYYAP